MSILFEDDIDLADGELLNARIQNISGNIASPLEGHIWDDINSYLLKIRSNGVTEVVPYLATSAPITLSIGQVAALGSSNRAMRSDALFGLPGLATTSVSGFMSFTDKSNLDLVYANVHSHSNKSNLDTINQDLSTINSPYWTSLRVGLSGLQFPNDPFGGGGDTAGIRLINKGGEAQSLEIYVSNDGDDWINLIGTDNNIAKVNGNTIWNAGNLTQASINTWNDTYNRLLGSRVGRETFNSNDAYTMAQRNAYGVSFGRIFSSTSDVDTPELGQYFNYMLLPEAIGGFSQTSLAMSTTNHSSYIGRGGYNTVMEWDRIWTSFDFSQSNINNWNSAYSNTHTHSNKANLDLINQNLSDSGSPTFTQVSAWNGFVSINDGFGLTMYDGSKIYKKTGTGLVTRLHTGNTRMQVEDNAGNVLGTYWDSGNLTQSSINSWNAVYSNTINTSNAPASSSAPSIWNGNGLETRRVYSQDYPSNFGNVISVFATGANQLFMGWSGANAGNDGLWFRNKRDAYDGWGSWQRVLDTVSDAGGIANWNDAYSKVITSRIAQGTYNANDSLTMAQRNANGVSFGRIFSNSPTVDTPELGHYFSYMLLPETPGANSQTSLAISNTNHSSYVGRGGWNSVMDWDRIWTTYDFTSSNVSNWNTAYANTHTHSNKSNLDTINQNLSTSDSPTFASVNVGTSGIKFPDNPFGGTGDASGIRLISRTGEHQSLEIYISNDPEDWINFIGNDNNFVKINGNTVWNVSNLTNLNQLANGPGYITGNQLITLSGEASGSGTTGISVTLNNASVIGKLLTGYAATSGTISDSDSLLSAIQKLSYDKHVPITLGTSNGLSILGQQISLGLSSSTLTGALSSTDWVTFNNKQSAIYKTLVFARYGSDTSTAGWCKLGTYSGNSSDRFSFIVTGKAGWNDQNYPSQSIIHGGTNYIVSDVGQIAAGCKWNEFAGSSPTASEIRLVRQPGYNPFTFDLYIINDTNYVNWTVEVTTTDGTNWTTNVQWRQTDPGIGSNVFSPNRAVVWESSNFDPNSKSNVGHIHDDRYYTESESNNLLSAKLDRTPTNITSLNANSYNNNGIYVGYNVSNAPNTLWGVLRVWNAPDDAGDQVWQEWRTASYGDQSVWKRGSADYGATWTAWAKNWDSLNFDPTTKSDVGHTHSITNITDRTSGYVDDNYDVGTAKYLRWKNYGDGHEIIDASNGTSPTGSTISRINPDVTWAETYPTLMGWNGNTTYGVRVDRSRYSDNADALEGHAASYFAVSGHIHDDRYYTESESNSRFLGIGAKAVDSDLFDGIDSSRFVFGANGSATSYVPGLIGGILKSGFYNTNSSTDSPVPSTWTHVIHSDYIADDNWAWQLAANFEASNSEDYWTRIKVNGNYKDWRKIWTTKDISQTNINNWNTAYSSLGNYLPLSGGTLTGNLQILAGATGWGEGIRVVAPAGSWGGLRLTRANDTVSRDGNWAIGYANNSTGDLEFHNYYNGNQHICAKFLNAGGVDISETLTANKIITTNNGDGENFRVGDDAWIGDVDVANTIWVKGTTLPGQGYVGFGSDSNKLGYTGSFLSYSGMVKFGPGTHPEIPGNYQPFIFDVTNAGGWGNISIVNNSPSFATGITLKTTSNTNSTWNIQKRDDGLYGTSFGCFAIEDSTGSSDQRRFPIVIDYGDSGFIRLSRPVTMTDGKQLTVFKNVDPSVGNDPWTEAPIQVNRASVSGADVTNVAGIAFHNQGVNASLFYYDPGSSQFKYRRSGGGTTQTFWDSGNFNPGLYLPLTGGIMSGDISFANSGVSSFRGLIGQVGDNDFWRVGGGATASNAGYLEIATADNSDEPIYVRQYSGGFSSLTRTAILLDGVGNTSFPGQVSAGSVFTGSYGLAGAYGSCGIYAGNADNATLTNYNMKIKSWWGIGFESYDAITRIVMDTRIGQITASTFAGALSGNATTATTLQNARTLTIGGTGKTFNGSANVSWSLADIIGSLSGALYGNNGNIYALSPLYNDYQITVKYSTNGDGYGGAGVYINGNSIFTAQNRGINCVALDHYLNVVTAYNTVGYKSYDVFGTNTLWETFIADVNAASLPNGTIFIMYSVDAISGPTPNAIQWLKTIGSNEISTLNSNQARRGCAMIWVKGSFGIIETAGRKNNDTSATTPAHRGQIVTYKSNIYSMFDMNNILNDVDSHTSPQMNSTRFGKLLVGRNYGVTPTTASDMLHSAFVKKNESLIVDGNAVIGGLLNIDGTFGSATDNGSGAVATTPALLMENKLVMYSSPMTCGGNDLMIGAVSGIGALSTFNASYFSNTYIDADNAINIGTLAYTTIKIGMASSSNQIYITGDIRGDLSSFGGSSIDGFLSINASNITSANLLTSSSTYIGALRFTRNDVYDAVTTTATGNPSIIRLNSGGGSYVSIITLQTIMSYGGAGAVIFVAGLTNSTGGLNTEAIKPASGNTIRFIDGSGNTAIIDNSSQLMVKGRCRMLVAIDTSTWNVVQ